MSRMKRISLIFLGVVMSGLTLATPVNVMAEKTEDDGDPKSICADTSISEELRHAAGCDDEKLISNVAVNGINAVVGIVGLITVAVMIYGGVIFVTSQGDSNKVKRAQYILIYGAVGLVVCLLAFTIVNFVSAVL